MILLIITRGDHYSCYSCCFCRAAGTAGGPLHLKPSRLQRRCPLRLLPGSRFLPRFRSRPRPRCQTRSRTICPRTSGT